MYMKEGLDCVELEVDDGKVESLWVRNKGCTNKRDVIVEVCYRPPGRDDDTNELFFKELRDA